MRLREMAISSASSAVSSGSTARDFETINRRYSDSGISTNFLPEIFNVCAAISLLYLSAPNCPSINAYCIASSL